MLIHAVFTEVGGLLGVSIREGDSVTVCLCGRTFPDGSFLESHGEIVTSESDVFRDCRGNGVRGLIAPVGAGGSS